MAWTPDVIYKVRRLRPPIFVGALRITDGKGCIIFNFRSRAWCSGDKIESLCGIVRTGDANVSDGSQYLS